MAYCANKEDSLKYAYNGRQPPVYAFRQGSVETVQDHLLDSVGQAEL